MYFDRHADLNVPASTIDGALDWMGVAHMLGVEGTVEELSGERPLLDLADGSATSGSSARRRSSAGRSPAMASRSSTSTTTSADPVAAARAALATLETCPELAVHFDVDVLDFLDAPLAENTDRGGLPLAAAARHSRRCCADPRVSALTVTEFNPHHGAPDGATTRRLIDVLADALS